jgi:hypothetical protein
VTLLEWLGRSARLAFFTGSGVAIICGLFLSGFGFVFGVSCFLALFWLSWVFNPPIALKKSDYAEWGESAILVAVTAFGAWAWWTGRLSL